MKDTATYNKYSAICDRAERLEILTGEKITAIMDIESADDKFNLRLGEWLDASDADFAHDFCGIAQNVNRSTFPATDFGNFVPRFAGVQEELK